MPELTHVYTWRRGPGRQPNPVRAALCGRLCRVVCAGRMGSALIEMEDGTCVVTSWRAVRKAEVGDVIPRMLRSL